MEAIREIVNTEQLMSVINIPVQMQNTQVEVIILPLSKPQPVVHNAASMMGCLKQYANPAFIDQEKSAWQQHLQEKHGNL
ncbi:MAG: hypothetical protein EZS26_004028 [Candidatus Ordinivivax streblomastigis]|uniref:Uncharacterized protein n=1 Tax=Candidatus Ordinivivax streblomastigis TaxID=2540710 RepID=A0A5M8NU03_9BACT|nr:MAG: hypothetical protein EZS26_004028 [Candidatus Ordinivivax streblomastigis]